MKQLIPQSKIDEAAKKYALLKNNEHEITFMLSKSDFKSGVQFALNKIQPLMVEFAEWVAKRYTLSLYNEWCSLGMPTINTTQQLLEEFIKSKQNPDH